MRITRRQATWLNLAATVVLLIAAITVPAALDLDVAARRGLDFPPLHGYPDPGVGAGFFPALLRPAIGETHRSRAARLPYRQMMVASYIIGLAWILSLVRVLGNPYE